jgi:hypothetical protein
MNKLLKNIEETDIKIDFNKIQYNVGDILNAPYYLGLWEQNPYHNKPSRVDYLNNIHKYYEKSILSIYAKDRPDNEKIPNIDRLKNSVNTYKNNNIDNNNLNEIINIIKESNILTVHLRAGDKGIVDNNFVKIIHKMSLEFDKVIIFLGIHNNFAHANKDTCILNSIKSLNKIINKDNIYVYFDNPDNHLLLISIASNLLIHKGGYSTIASFLCTGNLYITSLFGPLNHERWKNEMKNKIYTVIDKNNNKTCYNNLN